MEWLKPFLAWLERAATAVLSFFAGRASKEAEITRETNDTLEKRHEIDNQVARDSLDPDARNSMRDRLRDRARDADG